jgi:hypothetical protein
MKRTRIRALPFSLILATTLLSGQHQHDAPPPADSQPMDHATMAMSEGKGHHHDMGPHMRLTGLRNPDPQDGQRARAIVDAAKRAIAKYQDAKAAEADGFRMFLPNVKHQKMYHFTNYEYGFQAAFGFDPQKPTSLLYENGKDGKLKLIGLMYTAPARFTEDQLNERIPLSVAQWHLHTNLCIPPRAERDEMFKPNARFGLNGSITTEAACKDAGGTFRPRIFGWMVHMYPYEKTMDAIWSVERQRNPLATTTATRSSGHQH